MAIINGSRTGTVFELAKPSQILIESIFRTKNLTNAIQEFSFENLSTGQISNYASSEIGLTKAELITSSVCLFLPAGLYRWAQTVKYQDRNIPDFIRHDKTYPRIFPNFGLGGVSPLEILNSGTNNINTHISTDGNRDVYAKGKVNYTLGVGEQLAIEVIVTNTQTGSKFLSGVTSITGPKNGMKETGLVPFQTALNVVFKVELLMNTNSLTKQSCSLVIHG
ncbi:hypothetical protein [Sphingobacterium sp.]|uniref:hypothetical protein n=1 Tax=Sphingobacterium sp. TaxID=341027 RepID=UPI002589AF3B|nr:hypothetical protein [Sphingobacterium sp.]WET67849.1 MAG: hypothetical protein P0Y57_18585 [Sphingobacterium sp.]